MSEKTKVKLNIGERFGLFGLLPKEGDLLTYKTIRVIKEVLNPNDEETKAYEFESEFKCGHRTYDKDGKRIACEVSQYSKSPIKCHIHDELMQPTGMLRWKPEMAQVENEFELSPRMIEVIKEALKKLADEKKLTDQNYGLYVKFWGEE